MMDDLKQLENDLADFGRRVAHEVGTLRRRLDDHGNNLQDDDGDAKSLAGDLHDRLQMVEGSLADLAPREDKAEEADAGPQPDGGDFADPDTDPDPDA